ncbi:MAG TPA: glycosyltransferase [Candidatus Limnocylindria bacterium]|nr:glycosyltransferase [Candidatus Limnocylindria bacterium]
MNAPQILFLVNGGPDSIEAVRARGLARHLSSSVRFLFREGSRLRSLWRWHRELKRSRPDLVYVLNTALPGAVLAVWWKRVHGLPYLLDTGDAIYWMARLSGIQAGWRLPLIGLMEKLAQSNADTIVVRGTRHREYLLSRGFRRVSVVRDGYAEQGSATPESVASLRQQLGLDGRFVVGVMGSLVFSPRLNLCYGWDLIQALAQLKDLPVTGLVIGDGNGRAWLEAQARQAGVAERIRFCGRIPYAQVPSYLRLMDVALSTQTNNIPGQVRTTGKLPEYMAAECFILASRVGEAAILLPELMLLSYSGEVDPSYPTRLAERVRLLHEKPQLREIRHRLPSVARRECNYEALSQTLEQVIRSL